MGISTLLSRFAEYYRRHGFSATLRRLSLAVKRALFSSRSVLFYCDFATLPAGPAKLPDFLTVERKQSEAEISPEDFTTITSFWNPKLARRNIKGRFAKGASLWLIKSNGSLAGYGWTLRGKTMEPHYFPLGPDDVQFLDFHVFPKFRGRAMDWVLITQILRALSAEGLARAFGEAGEWNEASLASFRMSPFRALGSARKFAILGHTLVTWSEKRGVRASTPILQPQNPRAGLGTAQPVPLSRRARILR
jgi:ribosomal protein S18 acetylase RimI-like enzyme